jgi:hypothetical protein
MRQPKKEQTMLRSALCNPFLVALGLTFATGGAAAAVFAVQTPPTAEDEGFVSLFNGQDLAGWKASEDPASFTVRDGMIVAQGRPRSHLYYIGPVSSADFADFELKVDVKTEPDSNGGVYFHTRYVDNNWPQAGCEVQVNNAQKEKRKTGSLYAIQDIADSPVKDGEWFNLHIIVRDKTVVVRVNGKTVVDWTQPADFQSPKNPTWSDRRLSSGTVALQAHDAKSRVYYKNVRIKLADGPAGRSPAK